MIYLPQQDCFIHDGILYHISGVDFDNNMSKTREFKDHVELINSPDNSKGFLPVYCIRTFWNKNGKTQFAELLDSSGQFKIIISGNRKVGNKWKHMNINIKKDKSYLLWCESRSDFPDEFRVLALKELGLNKN